MGLPALVCCYVAIVFVWVTVVQCTLKWGLVNQVVWPLYRIKWFLQGVHKRQCIFVREQIIDGTHMRWITARNRNYVLHSMGALV